MTRTPRAEFQFPGASGWGAGVERNRSIPPGDGIQAPAPAVHWAGRKLRHQPRGQGRRTEGAIRPTERDEPRAPVTLALGALSQGPGMKPGPHPTWGHIRTFVCNTPGLRAGSSHRGHTASPTLVRMTPVTQDITQTIAPTSWWWESQRARGPVVLPAAQGSGELLSAQDRSKGSALGVTTQLARPWHPSLSVLAPRLNPLGDVYRAGTPRPRRHTQCTGPGTAITSSARPHACAEEATGFQPPRDTAACGADPNGPVRPAGRCVGWVISQTHREVGGL